jgi:hypothetical protein
MHVLVLLTHPNLVQLKAELLNLLLRHGLLLHKVDQA